MAPFRVPICLAFVTTFVNQVLAISPLPPHPRIRLLDRDLAALKNVIATDPIAAKFGKGVEKHGEDLLTAPLVIRTHDMFLFC